VNQHNPSLQEEHYLAKGNIKIVVALQDVLSKDSFLEPLNTVINAH
jgi:hypothetical protein